MADWRLGQSWRRKDFSHGAGLDSQLHDRRSIHGVSLSRPRFDKGQDSERSPSVGLWAFVLSVGGLVALSALDLAWGAEVPHSENGGSEIAIYARAVEHCRGNVERPMALDLDKRVMCFDGQVLPEQDFSLANGLREGGLFVVRSFGGDGLSAIRLAEELRERRAMVVVYDHCLSACASYLLFASTTAFVLRNTLVAWHHPIAEYLCPSLEQAKDGGPRRLEKNTCSDAPLKYQGDYKYFKELDDWFYGIRAVSPPFETPPESIIVRRILRNKFGERGTYPPDLLWTWNPRYYAGKIKTKVIYEAYPQSQDEVDAMASRLQVRVIYDP